MSTSGVEDLRDAFPEAARDLRLNLESVLAAGGSGLTPAQRWGVAIASAVAARNPRLRAAIVADARREVPSAVIEDAVAAAALMGMNNVYYRFRHLAGKPVYGEKPARLRMNRMMKPATTRIDFELFSLAVSAVNACESCIQSHERTVVNGGVTEDQVHDAIRIAAAVCGAAVALEAGEEMAGVAEEGAVA